ncbi:DNA-binding protein [Thalassotalea sp. 42_200_T64]|nr:DNA-binding protein [Thalassotalea sp. 42_200_T64]
MKEQEAKEISKFSIYLAVAFLSFIAIAFTLGHFPQNLVFVYFGLSIVTFFAYARDKSKAKRNAWRIKESTLHLFALIGGWPGAAMAQQLFRHKSQKRKFRVRFWLTVIVNAVALCWLMSPSGKHLMNMFL